MTTSSLPGRVAVLRASLTALDGMSSNVQETGLLTDLRDELRKQADALGQSLAQCRLLAKGGVAVSMPPSLDVARARAAALRVRFVAEPKATTLKKGNHWTSLIRELRAAAADAADQADSAWRAYRGAIFTGETPAVIGGRIAATDQNRAAHQRYEIKYRALRAAFEVLPQSLRDIERVRDLARELTSIAGEFDFNVPTEVKAFLAAVQGGGAPLDLLTPAVAAWLKERNAFSAYRIVPGR